MSSSVPDRPNILFILSDDQGPHDMGCAGSVDAHTPSLDAMAEGGTRLSRFFCTSPVCSPARASLLTGLMPSQHGVHDWIQQGNVDVDYLESATTYAELLHGDGYVCGLSGKWHLGASQRPHKGFSSWYALRAGASSYIGAPIYRNGVLIEESRYLTDAITDEALGFLRDVEVDDQPFYLSVHYTAPHYPWIGEHPEQDLERYRGSTFASCPIEPEHPWSRPTPLGDEGRTRREECLQGYFASITAMDRNIGRLLSYLDSSGLTNSTIVWFLSDNGFNTGHHGTWGKGNGTFPQNMYDTSVMVPAIVRQPGRIAEGAVVDALVSGYDVFPTMLSSAGINWPAELMADRPGRDLMPMLHGSDVSGHDFVVIFDEYGPVRMIRERDWKYVHRYPYGPHELYDLANDPGERKNLVDSTEHESRVAEMRGRVDEWFLRYLDPRMDGARQPVSGRGQIARLGPDLSGRPAFREMLWESESLGNLLGPE